MNIDGYQSYLKRINKWDSFAGNEIQKLAAMEKQLNIDLDDYIPYNGNYAVVEALHGLMTEDMRYSETLNFAINRYMVYRLGESDE